MVVAKTKCWKCEKEIELDDEYSWTPEDEDDEYVECDECLEDFLNCVNVQ